MRAAALALVVLAAAALASTAGAVVTGGTIVVNRGSHGIRLGMARSTVVDKLGPPVYANSNGFMQYGPDDGLALFDVYLGGANRVRQLGISGSDFCLRSGICMFTRYGLRKLRHQFGDRLKELTIADSGEPVNVVRGRFDGHRVFTAFFTTSQRGRAKIIMVFIGRCPPRPTVCGT